MQPVGQLIEQNIVTFADFVGNAQYISIGNLDENNKVFIFLTDYPNRRRTKIRGTAKVVEGDDVLLNQLANPEYRGKPVASLRLSR